MLLREDRNKWINVAIKKSHLFTDTESDLKCFKYRSFLGKIWFVCVKEQYFDTGTDWWDAWQWFTLWATRHFILCAKHSMKMFFVTYSVPKKKIWCLFSRAHEALLDKQQVESLNNKTMLPSNGQSLQQIIALEDWDQWQPQFWLKQCKVITDWSLYWRIEWGGLLMLDFKLSVL